MGKATGDFEPRIYVACLAAYNSGNLHGAWIDATGAEGDVRAGIEAMLKRSPVVEAEEFAIHDYDGFGGVRIEEYASIDTVAEIADFIHDHATLGAAVLEHFCGDLDQAREALENHYCGRFASLADWVQDVTEEAMTIPEPLRYYIDWEAMARDAALNGDVFTVETAHDEVHVFHA